MNKKILFIVEGVCDEVDFLEKLFKVSRKSDKYDIYSFETNIHVLASKLAPTGNLDKELDIKQVLKEMETDKEKREILSQEFSDIYLVFDFEPHEDYPKFEIIKQMLEFFNDSTTNGKLYINYPMMQSYKHFSMLPNPNFKELMISKESAKNYKKIVGDVSKFTDLRQYDYSLFVSLAYHHLLKNNYIRNGDYKLPTREEFIKWNELDLFIAQRTILEKTNSVFVLNTIILILIDYNTRAFYSQITTHASRYAI